MPDNRRPCIVKHPLNDASRRVLVPAVCLEHGANAFVAHKLRFESEVLSVVGLAIASFQRIRVHLDGLELPTTRVVVPIIINRPQMIVRQHCAQALDWRHRRSGTGLRIEPIRTTASAWVAVMGSALGILRPIGRSDVLVRPGHLHAAFSRDRSRLGCR